MNTKIKMKLGVHEFEAEGAESYINDKFDEFKALIERFGAAPLGPGVSRPSPAETAAINAQPMQGNSGSNALGDLGAIFQIDEGKKRVALHVHIDDKGGKVQQAADAMLVILYGYKKYFQIEDVGAVPLSAAVKNCIGQTARPDLAVPGLVKEGSMTRSGGGRGTIYRITPRGSNRAEVVMRALLEKIGG